MLFSVFPFDESNNKSYKKQVIDPSFEIQIRVNKYERLLKSLLEWDPKKWINSSELLRILNGCEDQRYKTKEAVILNSKFYTTFVSNIT